MKKIVKARKMMQKAFEADPDFRMGYQANIAMLIYDDQTLVISGRYPLDLSTKEGCNNIADRILKLIFDE